MRSARVFLSWLLVLLGLVFNPPSTKAYTAADGKVMIDSFNAAFYFVTADRGYFRNTTAGGTTWFWGRANQMEMLIDLYEQTTNTAYLAQFDKLYNGFVADYGSNWSWNEFNDDIMWMVIACSRAYQKTGNPVYRSVARSNFDACYARAWSDDLGGGLWWKSPLNTSKNACVNGPASIAAYLIYQNDADPAYLEKARAIFLWEKATLVDPNTGRVYDSIYHTGSKDTTPITYNQGTFIGAANYLGYTNDAILAANYTRNSMGSGGLLPNYDEHNDLGGFNGIFVRWMVKFMQDRNLQSTYQPWLQQNANAAWNVRRSSDNLSWSKWGEQTPAGTRYSFGCWGSVLIVNLLAPTQNPSGDAVFLSASDSSNTSSFESGLNWADGVAPGWRNHYVVSGGRTLRTPQDNLHHSFAGSSLTLSNGGSLVFKNTSGTRYISIGTDLFLDGGEIGNWSGNSAYLAGKMTVRAGGARIDLQGNTFNLPCLIGGAGGLRIGATGSSPVGGTVTLSGANTYRGGTVIDAPHTVQLSGSGTLGDPSGPLDFANTVGRGFGTLNLNGTHLTVGSLSGAGGVILNNKTGTTNTLTAGFQSQSNTVFRGVVGNGAGVLAFIKAGSKELVFAGQNTYTGPTVVSGGTLVFTNASSGRSESLSVAPAAVCRIFTSLPVLNPVSSVKVQTGGKLELGSGATQTARYLVLDGVVQSAGTWGSSGSTAIHHADEFLSGTGVLTVSLTQPAPALLTTTAGEGVINLQWNASAGAASYTVMRAATSGGPYMIAASGITNTTYADPSIAGGKTYYYVVKSVSAVGESVLSSEASAWVEYSALVRLLASDSPDTSSFNASGHWSSGSAPRATNHYEAEGLVIRTPTSGSHTFGGGSLRLRDGAVLALKSGGTTTIGADPVTGLTLDDGWIGLWIGGQATVAGFILLETQGGGFDAQANAPLVIQAPICGLGHLKVDTAPGNTAVGGTLMLTASNSYQGGTIIDAAMTLKLTDAATLGAATGSFSILNTNSRGYGTLDLNGTSQDIGGLFGTGGVIVNNLEPKASVLTFGNGNANGDFAGSIQAGRGILSVRKTGTGSQVLSATNTYTGETLVEAGEVSLVNQGCLPGSRLIVISSGAVLNVSRRTDQRLTLGRGQALSGEGMIQGNVQALPGSSIEPGNPVGTLLISGMVNLSGPVIMELDNANPSACDCLSASVIDCSDAVLVVTNRGTALQRGDVFRLFSTPPTGEMQVRLPLLGHGLTWSNSLAIDGCLRVIPSVSTEAVTLSFSLVADPEGFIISWPESHIGWQFQMQTNSFRGITAEWIDVPVSAATNRFVIRRDSLTNGFFRLAFP